MRRKRFEQLVAEALRDIPKFLRDEMENVAVRVEDEPSAELLEEMGIEPPDTLYGLYQGTPLAEREWAYGNTLPDCITIYQRPIVEDCEDDKVEAAYARSDLFERRRRLMDDWATYVVDEPEPVTTPHQ